MSSLFNIMVCPTCRGDLTTSRSVFRCITCQVTFSKHPKLNFLNFAPAVEEDTLDNIKSFVKKFPQLYIFLAEFISPVFISKKRLKKLIAEIENGDLLGLNIGSGVTNYSKKIINFDFQDFKHVQVIGDLFELPFKDNSFDYVFSIYVLEHVPDPERAIKEMYRVLKPGGKAYCLIPFIQGFHAAPADYIRLTTSGVKYHFSQFSDVKIKGLGPTSAFLWIFQEWLSILFSFGSKRLSTYVHILLMLTTFPFKFFDLILSHFHASHKIAVANEVLATK